MLKMAFWQKSGCLIDHISRALLLFHRGNQELMGKGFPGGSVVKNLLAHAGDGGSIPGQEDPLEKEMATHSSILTWKIPWTEEPGGLQFMGHRESDMTE